MNADEVTHLLRFFGLASDLKRVRRQGWVDRGVRNPESVGDHSWAVALLAWVLAGERYDLNRERVLLLGLVHDLPEALAGDTTPFDVDRDAAGRIAEEHFGRPPVYTAEADERKRAAEAAALEEMLAGLPEKLAGEIRSAWWEYEEAVTAEARFVKQVDKLETVIQAESYREQQPRIVTGSFQQGALRDIQDERLREVLKRLISETGG